MKQLRCPNCGHVFKAPVVDEKDPGLGWTLPYSGEVLCPKCGQNRQRAAYEEAI